MGRTYNLNVSPVNRRRFEPKPQRGQERPEGAACPTGSGALLPLVRDSVAGLSKPHTITTTPLQKPAPTSRLTYYKGASLVDIEGPRHSIQTVPSRGGKRREISGMSLGSRMRIRQKMAKVKCEEMTNALTVCLTYPRNVVLPEEWQVYKNHLRVFNQSVKRHYEGSSGIWVLEFQKSGAPHFHLLIFGLRHLEIEDLRQWMQAKWYEIAHNGDIHQGRAGTTIEWAKSGGGVMGYMAKYMSKSYQQDKAGHTGRMWGKFGELPIGKLEQLECTEKQMIKIRRWARKKTEKDVDQGRWNAFLRPNGKSSRKPSPAFGQVMPNAHCHGGRMYWEKAKSAWHGGADSFSFYTVRPPIEIGGELRIYGVCSSSTDTKVVEMYRPPSRWKAKCNDRVRLICNADAFMQAIATGIERDLI